MFNTSSVFAWSSSWTTLQPTPTIKSLENLLILSIFISPLLMIGILIRFWWGAVSASFIVTRNLRSFVRVTTFYQSSETLSSTFWNFFHILWSFLNFFSLSLIFFYWFGRSVLFLACLCFVPLLGGDRHIIHMFSPNVKHFFEKFVKKSFKKILSHWIRKKKSRTFFSPALPFYGDYMQSL